MHKLKKKQQQKQKKKKKSQKKVIFSLKNGIFLEVSAEKILKKKNFAQ